MYIELKIYFLKRLIYTNVFQRYYVKIGQKIQVTMTFLPIMVLQTFQKRFFQFSFSSSTDYISCLYTATALGCSMQAADVYFEILKRSLSLTFSAEGLNCVLRHPLDVISVYTTTSSTTTEIRSTSASTDKSRDSAMLARGTSSCSRLSTMHNKHFLIWLVLNLIYFSVT